METILVILVIYIIGCILSYGRHYARMYEIDEDYINTLPPYKDNSFTLLFSLFSWVGFIAGIIIYFGDEEKYFLKYSNKPLWDKYNKRYENNL